MPQLRSAVCFAVVLASTAAGAAALVSTSLAMPAKSGSPLKVVAFGTSLSARGGWQPALEAALARCLARPVTVATVARSGAGTPWALGQVEAVLAESPDVVLIEFASNDAALNRFTTIGLSRANLDAIVSRLLAAPQPPRLFIMAMNPIHGPRGWIRPFLDRYTDAHRELAAARGIGFIDHRPAWSRLSSAELRAAIPDGSHPRADVAARVIAPEAARSIAGTECRP